MISKHFLFGLSSLVMILSGCQFSSTGKGGALTGIFAGIGLDTTAQPPNVYKTCSLDTHKVIYKKERSSLCGGTEVVENYHGPECGVETYKSCRANTNPVEDSVIDWGSLHNFIPGEDEPTYEGWKEDPAPDGSPYDYDSVCKQTGEFEAEDLSKGEPSSEIWKVFDVSVERGVHTIKKICVSFSDGGLFGHSLDQVCPVTKSAYRCHIHLARYKLKYKDQPNPICGPETYKECTATVNKECRLQQFGIEGYESEADSNCGVDSQLASQQNDETYLKILSTEFRSLIADHGEKSLRWDNVAALSQESNLKGRAISFAALTEMKMIANSVDLNNTVSSEQKSFNRYFKLLAIDTYTRMVAAYNQQRLKDVLAIEEMMAQVQDQTLSFTKAAERAQTKIKDLGLSTNVANAIISDIQKAHDKDAKAVVAVFKDLAHTIRKSIQLNITETDGWIRSLVDLDPLFQISLIEVFLLSGDFDQAQLKLVDAAAAFRLQSDPKLAKKNDWFFQNLQKNAQVRAQQELDSANEFFQIINTTASIPSVMAGDNGSEVLIPTSVLAVLTELQLTGGEALDGVKFQLLDLIDRNLIQPLTAFVAKTDIVL